MTPMKFNQALQKALYPTLALGCCVAVLGEPARGQADLEVTPIPLAGPVVDAGIIQLHSGIRRPRNPQTEGLIGSIYANTCSASAFVNAVDPGTILVDEGRVPSTSSTAGPVGNLDAYRVTGFTFGYATRALDTSVGGPGAHALVELFERYQPCAPLTLTPPPKLRADLHGLPGVLESGQIAAYLVTIELDGALEFCQRADADGTFDGNPLADSFGVAMRLLDEIGGTAGFLLSGPSAGCAVGDGTRWQNPDQLGAGLGNFNFMRREGSSPGCISFGATAYAGLFFALHSNAPGTCAEPGTAYCFGTACPCANDDPDAGCRNGPLLGADLRGYGSASVAADDLVLTCSGLPVTSIAGFFMAPLQQSASFGGGLLCASPGPPQSGNPGPGYVRFPGNTTLSVTGIVQLGPGIASLSLGSITVGATRNFQCWYRNVNPSCGTSFNLSNAYTVTFAD